MENVGGWKNKYESPRIISEVKLSLEQDLLAGSVVDSKAEVESIGQEVIEIDASTFTSEWE